MPFTETKEFADVEEEYPWSSTHELLGPLVSIPSYFRLEIQNLSKFSIRTFNVA